MPEAKHSTRKSKFQIVLDALMAGREVQLGEYVYAMDLEDHEIGIVVHSYKNPTDALNDQNAERQLHIVQWLTVGQLWKMCEKLTDDEVFLIGAGTALDKINRKER